MTLQNLVYDYDSNGNITSLDNQQASELSGFSYDILNRLTAMSVTSGGNTVHSEVFSYEDTTGRMAAKGPDIDNLTYFDYVDDDDDAIKHPHAVAEFNGKSYVYDSNGNQVERDLDDGTYVLTYDGDNKLVQVDATLNPTPTPTATASPTPTGTPIPTEAPPQPLQQAQYFFDGDGAMVKSVVNGKVTYYVGSIYQQEVDGGATTYQKYYAFGGQTVAVRTGTLGQQGTLKWTMGDHLGSTSVTANEDGTWNSEIKYTAFGEVRTSSGITPTDRRFTGQRLEAEFGLYYYVARWYDPTINHFTQPDTVISDPGKTKSWDRYAYTENNPILCS